MPLFGRLLTLSNTMSHDELPVFSCYFISQTTLAEHIIELTLTRPDHFHWQVGDYLWLGSEKTEAKPFSIANLPHESVIKLQIAVIPTLVDWLDDTLRCDVLQIKGAVNQYHWPHHQQPTLMLAGGTGITPLLALLQGHRADMTKAKITLYWGVKRAALLFARAALDELAAENPLFSWQAIVSEDDETWTGLTGLLPDVLAKHPQELTHHNVIICGPWPMVSAIKQWALTQGAQANAIQ